MRLLPQDATAWPPNISAAQWLGVCLAVPAEHCLCESLLGLLCTCSNARLLVRLTALLVGLSPCACESSTTLWSF